MKDSVCGTRKDYAGASDLFSNLVQESADSSIASRALVARSLLELDWGHPALAADDLTSFLASYPEHRETSQVRKALTLLGEYENLPLKSEFLAGMLSALLPGSGYVYAGRYGDGLTAFLINALFIAGTVTAVQNEWYPVASLTGGIELPFYFGNIYGSVNAVKKHNKGIRLELRSKIADALAPIIDDKRIPDRLLSEGA